MNLDTVIKQEAQSLIKSGAAAQAIDLLEKHLQQNDACDEAWLLLGNAYRKLENWKSAMDSYSKAMELNPESPARDAYNMIVDILNFYDIQRYNV